MQIDPDVAAALLGAVVGAVVGGAASLAGSVFVERRKLVRETRIQMYRDIAPELVRVASLAQAAFMRNRSRSDEFIDLLDGLQRASAVAGRRDYRRVLAIKKLHKEILDFMGTQPRVWTHGNREVSDEDGLGELASKMRAELKKFSLYLERKLLPGLQLFTKT